MARQSPSTAEPDGGVVAPSASTLQTVLGGRFRLMAVVARGPRTTLWKATDETLARTVAVKVLDDHRGAEEFLAAAYRAGQLSHPGLASVYDASRADDGTAYVASQWVEGPSLAALLRDGPLPPESAVTIIAQVAQAVAAAHRAGVTHGRLHAGNVVVTPAGQAKVTDTAVAAAAAGPPAPGDPARSDTRALGALLYACLTGCWPTGADHGLRAAPSVDERVCTPRQVRAGVPREVDLVTVRALNSLRRPGLPAYTESAQVAAALAALVSDSEPAPGPRLPRASARVLWRLLRVALPVALLVAIGTASWYAGLEFGTVRSQSSLPALAPLPSAAPAQPEQEQAVVPLEQVSDFDPGGDEEENSEQVPLATDGAGGEADLTTAWTTARYKSPALGGLKDGVGLLVDLGEPTQVSRVQLVLTDEGADVELRPAQSRPAVSADAPDVVAAVNGAGDVVQLEPSPATTARYWVVWFTDVPGEGEDYQVGVADLQFLS